MKRIVVPAALVILLGANIHLLLQNRRLKTVGPVVSLNEIAPQKILRSIGGVDLGGRYTLLNFDEQAPRTLLITYSALCPYSEANRSFWLRLTHSADPQHWRIVWVSRDPLINTQAFAAKYQVPAMFFAEPAHRTYSQLAMEIVPRTVAVDRHGVVEKVWAGSLSDAQKISIEQHLSARSMASR